MLFMVGLAALGCGYLKILDPIFTLKQVPLPVIIETFLWVNYLGSSPCSDLLYYWVWLSLSWKLSRHEVKITIEIYPFIFNSLNDFLPGFMLDYGPKMLISIAVCFFALGAFLIILTCCFRSRINLSVAVLKVFEDLCLIIVNKKRHQLILWMKKSKFWPFLLSSFYSV